MTEMIDVLRAYGGILIIVGNNMSRSLTDEIVLKKFSEFIYTPEMFRSDMTSCEALAYLRCKAFLLTIQRELQVKGGKTAELCLVIELQDKYVVMPFAID